MGGHSQKQTTNSNTNSTRTNAPYAGAVPLIDDMLARATTAQANTPTTPIYTGPNANQTQAAGQLQGIANSGTLSSGAGAVRDLANKNASGFYLDPANNLAMQGSGWSGAEWSEDINPALQAMIKAAINPLRDQLDQNVLSIGDAAKMAGAYGGDRGELLKGTALSRFNRDAMDVGALYEGQAYENMMGRKHSSFESGQNRNFTANQNDFAARTSAWEAERGRQMSAGDQYADANNLTLADANLLGRIGDQQAQWDLAAKQAAVDAPWAGLDRYADIINTVQPYGTTTGNETTNSTTTMRPAGGGVGGAASGALGGASAGAAFGPWGAGIGAVLGGLGGLFG